VTLADVESAPERQLLYVIEGREVWRDLPSADAFPEPGRCLVAFECDHPWEAHCNPRTCGGGWPVLRRVYSGPPVRLGPRGIAEGTNPDEDELPVPVEEEPDEFPPDPVPRREARPEEIPGSAALLVRNAQAAGWRVRVWYRRHCPADQYGRPGRYPRPKVENTADEARAKGTGARMPYRFRDEVLVAMVHPEGHRALAEWRDGGARPGWLQHSGLWRTSIKVTELKRVVAAMTPRRPTRQPSRKAA
jgi:hypothetical protein